MWPGQQQPGGEQNPQQPNPYQQPGYQQPNPYQQPGYGQPQPGQGPNPYAQQPGQQPGQGPGQQPGQPGQPGQHPGQGWDYPTYPGGPQSPKGGGGKPKGATIAIITAVAVIAAAGVTGFFLFQGGDEEDTAGGGTPSASAKPSATAAEEDGKPEAGASKDPSEPVVPGWQTVINPKHYSAFDVPKNSDWEIASQSTITGFEDDKGKVLVAMSAPAYFKQDWCKSSTRGAVGTKGAQGSRNTKEAAEIAASNFVLAGYDQKQKGTLKETKAKPFANKHGIKGHIAAASVTGAPKEDKCSADGKAVAVSWINANDDLAIWVLYSDTGVKDEIPESTIKKMTASLRTYGEPGEGDEPRG
ncbi:hypothetical protein [Streptomyces daliensis]|uniref:DUF8017 domain-containing protein n=1 Tax=Streptomyces daliensis TaxID=299421 RepID=A0A8T4IYH0_9ACTN|nr:hypothetical protein [Streptomyces daliensis]